ncbi:MAG: TRAP transporter substrate-binding protein [Selenomonadaceae bacterium]
MLLKKKILAALSVVTLSAVMLAGCGGSDQAAKSSGSGSGDKIVLRYAENQSSDYPTTKAANKFADLVKEKTNGKITVQVYDGAQLGDEKSVVEQMQYGGIDFARVSLSPLSEFSKNLNALQLPYLYKDGPHMWKVLESKIGDDLLASVQEKGIIGLAWVDAGARNFYTTKAPIKTLEDLKGLKIRVQESSMMMDMIRALGASPTPMPYGEVYSGLQTGIIDGAENNWPSYESTSHYEVAKYYTIDEHNRVPEMMICSKQTWDKLSADDQKIVKDCALEAAKYERDEWAKREKSAEDKVKAGGAVITTLSDVEKKKFEDAMQPVYDKYATPYKDIVDQIKAMQKD